MEYGKNLLYIVYYDFSKSSGSASKVRPRKMYEAFQRIGMNVKLLEGDHREYLRRRNKIKEIKKWLRNHKVDFCYIELPSGPLFHPDDLRLIKYLHRCGIKIGIFYRDIYWMFPEMFHNPTTLQSKIKSKLIRSLQKRDLKVFKKHVDIVYIPSDTMGQYLGAFNYSVLPPGCDEQSIENGMILDTPKGIYVGGISERYGSHLLLESFAIVNETRMAELELVCPEAQWDKLPSYLKKYKDSSWLKVNHLSNESLNGIYAQVDYAIIPLKKNLYNDFAVPVKMYEYISYNKPILATRCSEVSKFVEKYQVGLIVNDTVEDLVDGINKFLDDDKLRNSLSQNLSKALHENRWEERCFKVVSDLLGE